MAQTHTVGRSPSCPNSNRAICFGVVERRKAIDMLEPMAKEPPITAEGTVTEVLPGTMFRVSLGGQRTVLAHISGKMRKRFIRITIEDRVKMAMSPSDTDPARIVYRL